MSHIQILNSPTHRCALPDPAEYANGTDVECTERVTGGRGPKSQCGRRYTRTETFWLRTPRWTDYDWGW